MKNVFQKINEVMKSIEYLTKDDKVEFGTTKYKAISEEKVTTAVRNELVRVGLVIIPVEQTRNTIELQRTEKSVNQRTDVDVVYRIQNIEDKEDYVLATSSGSGVDTQDKGVGKAMTYSYKYLLLRTFAIPTGEDPDKISSAETDAKISAEMQNGLITETQLKTLQGLIKQIKNNAKEYYDFLLERFEIQDLKDLKSIYYPEVLLEIKEKLGEN